MSEMGRAPMAMKNEKTRLDYYCQHSTKIEFGDFPCV